MNIRLTFTKPIIYVIIIAVLCSIIFISKKFMDSGYKNKESIEIKIEKGASAYSIGKMLKQNKIIKSKFYFLGLAKLFRVSSKLQAGIYMFKQNSCAYQVIKTLANGKSVLVKVTIPEGFNSKQIAERLSAKGLGTLEVFLKIISENKLEGYLYPETYFFTKGLDEKSILNVLVNQFHKNIDPIFDKFDFTEFNKKSNYKFGPKEAIILASLIEKEAKMENERPLISGVFHNRLKKHWRLESCASVQYVLGKTKNKLSYADLKIKSLYNTYLHEGLPPGPICSPGKESIDASLYPEATDALFFVKNNAKIGSHIFSRYYNAHVTAKLLNKKKGVNKK
jgi:UPF0755 protein